jgi:hypothetical protein
MSAGDTPRFVVTSLPAPSPARLYEDLYGARGNGEHALQAVQGDLHRDRTAATTVLANAMRLIRAGAASALHQAARTQTLPHTAVAQAQPSTIILPLCNIAAQVKQYTDRILLHLPSACPVQALRPRGTALRYAVPLPVGNTS